MKKVLERIKNFKLLPSYKAIQNDKYYLAFNRFREAAKKGSYNHAYLNGFRKWESDDMTTYAFVLGTRRIMFGIKKPAMATCAG